ncbi:hypothetical protein C8Q80DRAFT_1261427 [Daedaleopsis nitida]|nr:hypothetical protein C8Q80DRAFT_1261427 [Daedaleopsis nitida]
MDDVSGTGGLLDGILAVVHPELYRAAVRSLDLLYSEDPESRAYVDAWPCTSHAAAVIVNRESIVHRDLNGKPGWLDLLLSVGTYGETAVFSMGNIGASVPYNSGSVVLVSSRFVLHGVPAVPPDRMCCAWIVNHRIFQHCDLQFPDWTLLADKLQLVPG